MDEKVLEFAIFCVESLSEKLNMDTKELYRLIKFETDVLDKYIIPCYEPLHSQSKAYIVNDLIDILKERSLIVIVYHGSYCIVNKPDITFSREALDFGKGFYITNIKDQATNWVKRFKLKGQKSYINVYELYIEEIKELYKVKEFNYYDNDWLDFILQCRNRSNIFNNYDVLIGGIADDRVYNTMELYEDNLISKDEALKRLKFYKPNNQICIVNQEVIDKYLKYIYFEEV